AGGPGDGGVGGRGPGRPLTPGPGSVRGPVRAVRRSHRPGGRGGGGRGGGVRRPVDPDGVALVPGAGAGAARVRVSPAPPLVRMRMPDGQRPPERREQIVLAAAAVLGRDGYAATTLKQIAREADVAPGLLHYYFRSKDDLLIAVVEAVFGQFIQEWQESVDGLTDPFERISAAIDRFARICAERPEVTRLLLDFYALGVGTPALRDRTRRLLAELQEHVAEEIRLNTASLPTP